MAGVPRVGVINWDACLTSDTYFGGYAMRSLGCDRYEERIPFYACTDGYEFGEITLDRVETELRFASDAGVDFVNSTVVDDALVEFGNLVKQLKEVM